MTTDIRTVLLAKIEEVAAAERITKKGLSELSRELLSYLQATTDIDMVNRLIAVLTPMNKRTAILFFQHFLPYAFDEDEGVFGGLIKKEAKIKAKAKDVEAFLADATNDIWKWAAENLELDKKKSLDVERVLSGLLAQVSNAKLNPDDYEKVETGVKAETLAAMLEMLAHANDIETEAELEIPDQPA